MTSGFYLGDSSIRGGDFNSKHRNWNSHKNNRRGTILKSVLDSLKINTFNGTDPTYWPGALAPDMLCFFKAKDWGNIMHSPRTPQIDPRIIH